MKSIEFANSDTGVLKRQQVLPLVLTILQSRYLIRFPLRAKCGNGDEKVSKVLDMALDIFDSGDELARQRLL